MRRLSLAALLVLSFAVTAALAEERKPVKPEPATLRLRITLSRVLSGKVLGSQAFTLALEEGRKSFLTVGAETPIATPGNKDENGKERAFQYRNIGTTIEAEASARADGRFLIRLKVEHSTFEPAEPSGAVSGMARFRTLNFGPQSFVLGDGQSGEQAVTSQLLTEEQYRLEAALTVVR